MAINVVLVSFYFCFLFSSISSESDDNFAVLHATAGSKSRDYCVAYNWQGVIPKKLEEAPALVVAVAIPPQLCEPPINESSLQGKAVGVLRGNCTFYTKARYAQDAGAKEVIIITKDHLFKPSLNDSDDIQFPVAVVMDNDWADLMDLGETVKVQLYYPPPFSFDFNLIVIFVCAVFTVLIGAYWSGVSRLYTPIAPSDNDDFNNLQDEPPQREQEIEVTPVMVIIFVIMICASLLLMYFFYKYLVYVVIALFALASCNGLFECLCPILNKLPLGDCKVPPNRIPVLKHQPEFRYIGLFFFCLGMSIWWVIVRHESYAWVLQDFLGMAFCISLIKNIRLSSLKICALLLLLLLVYDVFFVFITPLFSAKESIMVKVATGDGSKEQIPMVLRVPKLTLSIASVCDRSYSLLGFGDILVPGLYVAYCHWFDIMTQNRRKIYFISVSIAYGTGLIVTFGALYLMKTGQPALVYLVPFTLTTGVVIALVRKELKQFWTGKRDMESQETNIEAPSPENLQDSEDDVILDRTLEDSPSDEQRSLLCR